MLTRVIPVNHPLWHPRDPSTSSLPLQPASPALAIVDGDGRSRMLRVPVAECHNGWSRGQGEVKRKVPPSATMGTHFSRRRSCRAISRSSRHARQINSARRACLSPSLPLSLARGTCAREPEPHRNRGRSMGSRGGSRPARASSFPPPRSAASPRRGDPRTRARMMTNVCGPLINLPPVARESPDRTGAYCWSAAPCHRRSAEGHRGGSSGLRG